MSLVDTYRQQRDANDLNGDLTFAAKMGKSAFKRAASAPGDLEDQLEMSAGEKLVWRLMKIPRRYADLETTGGLSGDDARRFLRALAAAELVEILDGGQGRAVVPLELSRLKRELKGKGPSKKRPVKKKAIHDRVFRPDIGPGSGWTSPTASEAVVTQEEPSTPPSLVSAIDESTLSSRELELKREIEAAHAALAEQDFYDILGVKKDANGTEIKTAYMKLVRKWHPDAISGTPLADDAVIRSQLDALFKCLQEAHATLSDPGSRNAYDQTQAATGGGNSHVAPASTNPNEAAILYHRGDSAMNAKDFVEAEARFREAYAADSESPNIQNALGWAIFMRYGDSQHTEEAKQYLTAALEKGFADAAYKLGLIARRQRNDDEAIKQFRECLKIMPRHAQARKELEAAIERRNRPKAEHSKDAAGLFGGLFNKKK